MMPKKLLISDYDRTLRIDDEISERDRRAIERFRQEGHLFVVNSGRSFQHLQQELVSRDLSIDYTITGSGSQVHDANGYRMVDVRMNSEDTMWLLEQIFFVPFVRVQICEINRWQAISRTSISKWSLDNVSYNKQEVNAISARFKTREEAGKFAERINASKRISAYHNGFSVDMTSYNISKSTGIASLIQCLDDHVVPYVIGDSMNDYEMIMDYNGYCVQFSDPRIIAVASKQVKDVAQLIEEILEKD